MNAPLSCLVALSLAPALGCTPEVSQTRQGGADGGGAEDAADPDHTADAGSMVDASGDSGTGDSATGLTADMVQFISSHCTYLMACPSNDYYFSDLSACVAHFSYVATCKLQTVRVGDTNVLMPTEREPTYDTTTGRICRTWMDSHGCGEAVSAPEECGSAMELFTGPRAGGGESCEQHLCADGLYCDNSGWETHTCRVCRPRLALGDACFSGALPCVDGAFCNGDAICASKLSVGEACGAHTWCASGFCDADGRCAQRPDLGDPCANLLDCARGICDVDAGVCVSRAGLGASCEDTYCMPPLVCVSDVCTELARTCAASSEGEFCGTVFPCAEGLYCDDLEETCKPKLAVGDDCAAAQRDACASDSYCHPTDKACAAYPDLGEACWGVCQSGSYCDMSGQAHVCASPKEDGEACDHDNECLSYTCSHGGLCIDAICVMPE